MKRNFLLTLSFLFLSSEIFISCGKKINENDLSIYNPITFTFYTADATQEMNFDDPVAKKITEETGVTLEVLYPKAGDTQVLTLMMASGKFPDLIYAKGDTTKLIDSKAVVALDDWVDENGNHIN